MNRDRGYRCQIGVARVVEEMRMQTRMNGWMKGLREDRKRLQIRGNTATNEEIKMEVRK